jgi:metallo-beta-lactamase family protein
VRSAALYAGSNEKATGATMRITFCGAAGEVTGSCYLIETRSARILVDCGLYQGRDATDGKNRNLAGLVPRNLDAVVLTHAHLDHCGRLPLLTNHGFRGKIHTTLATADFARLVLEDAAYLQAADVERQNRRRLRQGKPPIEPLYTAGDLAAVENRFRGLPYGEERLVAPGCRVRLSDAGHILGSASVRMTLEEAGRSRVLVFSGDLGPRGIPYLRDPVPPETDGRPDVVVMESTYGDREHRRLEETLDEFLTILRAAIEAQQKVLIPAFAIGRTQQILYHIAGFVRSGRLPRFPIYLDSPMAIRATELYQTHHDLFDEEAAALHRGGRLDRDLSELRFTATAEESRSLNDLKGMALIIAGSGMCEGGRILHHLKHNLWRPDMHVVIVGYQASGSLGAQLVHGAGRVRIHGEPIVVKAKIHTLGGFSAHAGQGELADWAGTYLKTPGGRTRLVLTHGEEVARKALANLLRERYRVAALLPGLGEKWVLE